MIIYTLGAHELNEAREGHFPLIVDALKGRSVISLGADAAGNRFELGLSGNVTLRMIARGPNMEVNCFSTQNRDEPIASALLLGEMTVAPVWQLEAKLRGLRTVFAIFYLIETGQQQELAHFLREHPFGDIDRALLAPEDQLHIESVSYGSWIATVRTRTSAALRAVVGVATIALPRARDAFLKKLEAEANIADTRARRDEVALTREQFELRKDEIDYAIELAAKIGADEDVREVLNRRLRKAAYDLAVGDLEEDELRRLARHTFKGEKKGIADE